MKLCGVFENCFDNKQQMFGHLSHSMCDYMSDNGEENICGLTNDIVECYNDADEYKELRKKLESQTSVVFTYTAG
jgi:hypothetical protein